MITIHTQHPVAVDSLDHIYPCGTKNDNSTNPAFNAKLYELIPAKDVRLLDLGCAGGGLVKSILDDGGIAVGIEGSDYSLKSERAAWKEHGNFNLYTADATQPFELGICSGIGPFARVMHWTWKEVNVVTAWEFFEHVPESKIAGVLNNIYLHVAPGWFFIGSINPNQHEIYHVTQQPKAWWLEKFASLGLVHAPDIEAHFGDDVVRREGFTIALRVA